MGKVFELGGTSSSGEKIYIGELSKYGPLNQFASSNDKSEQTRTYILHEMSQYISYTGIGTCRSNDTSIAGIVYADNKTYTIYTFPWYGDNTVQLTINNNTLTIFIDYKSNSSIGIRDFYVTAYGGGVVELKPYYNNYLLYNKEVA